MSLRDRRPETAVLLQDLSAKDRIVADPAVTTDRRPTRPATTVPQGSLLQRVAVLVERQEQDPTWQACRRSTVRCRLEAPVPVVVAAVAAAVWSR